MSRKLLFAVFAFLLVIAMTSTACCGISNIVEKAVGSLSDEDGAQDESAAPPDKPTESQSQPQEEPQDEVADEPSQPEEGAPTAPTTPTGSPGRTMYTNANQVEDLAVDGNTLWVATLGGVVAWDLETGESVQYTTLDGLSSNGVFAIEVCPMPDPVVLVGTDDGIDFFDPETGRWSRRPELVEEDAPDPGSDPEDYFRTVDEVSALHCDAENGRLFIDYWSIRILDLDSGDITELTEDEGLPYNGFSQIAISGSDIWIASGWNGIARVSNGTDITVFNEESGDLPNDFVDYIAVDLDGGVWAASSDGLHNYSSDKWTHYTSDDVEGFGSHVYDMAMAPDGSLWIGFSTKVCRFDTASKTCSEVIELGSNPGQADDWLSSVLLDYNGRFFYGTDSAGASMFDDSGWTLLALENQPLADNVVTSALEDNQGNIWIGTSSGGVTRFSPDGVSLETFTYGDSDINSSYIVDMAEDPKGGIWFLHSYSLSHYDGSAWTVYGEEDGLREDGGNIIAVDDAGQLWIGGDEGLSIFDGTNFTNVGVDDGLPEGVGFTALLPDGDVMWAGSSEGLFSFSGPDFTLVLTEDTPGLEDDTIAGIVKMPDGNMLLAHGYGLAVYEPGGDVTALEDGPSWVNDLLVLPTGDIWLAGTGLHHYDGSAWEVMTPFEGLPHMDMRAVLIDSQGALWAGGGSSGQGGGLVRISDIGQAGGPAPQPPASADTDGSTAPQPTGETTRQWASSATASSQYGSANWGPDQATGEPNTEGCGDFGTAWASSERSTVEWLELDYDTPVTPTEVNILQNYNPNQVIQVELIDTNGAAHMIYESPSQEVDCPYTLTIQVEDADYQAATIRITVDQSLLVSWNEIDAVELIGY
jgi:ligand-binding sensor domain-containing protein